MSGTHCGVHGVDWRRHCIVQGRTHRRYDVVVHSMDHGRCHQRQHGHPPRTTPWHRPWSTPWHRPWSTPWHRQWWVSMVLSMDDAMDHTTWTMPFRGTCHGCQQHIPWTCTMGATMESSLVHHGLWHGRRHGSTKCHGMLHSTYHGSDGAMVQSMDEWSSMAWSVASSTVDSMALSMDEAMASGVHGIVHGRRHGIVHGRCHGRSKECRSPITPGRLDRFGSTMLP